MFSKRVKHHHQWLRSAIPFKAKLDQISSDSVRVQGPTKRPSLGHLYPVSPVKERYRNGGKCKISRVLQSPVSSTQASPKVEASHRRKQAQHFSTRRKVQKWKLHPDFPDSRGMGIVDRSVRRLPTHPHPPNLKEIPKVLLQGSGVPVHLPPVRAGHSPPGLYNDCKGSETNGPLKRTQDSPIPGRLADQVPVSGGSPSEHTGSGRPNPVLGVDNKSGKIKTETYSGVFVRGLRIPPRFSPCKTHSREMAQTSGFDPTTRVKTCFDCKMFDVSNWIASLNGENGPGGTPSHEALSVSSQGALEISSVQPSAVNRMVTTSAGVQTDLPEVVHTSCRLICHSPEPQAPTVRVSYPRPKGLGHRCSKHKLDQPHSLCVPSYGSPSQGDPKDQAMSLPDHSNSPRLARDALVLRPSAALNRDPTTTPSVNNPTQTVPQVCVPQQPPTPEPPRLVSRSGQLQEQGISVELAERIAAPQRSSTRTIYKSKWAIFEKWCRENSVD